MNNKEKNFISAVIYVHNAQQNIENFLCQVASILEKNFEKSEIICVNDFSSDNSVALIKKLSKNFKSTCISVLNMSHFHGVELSMTAGVELAIGDFVFEFDSCVLDFKIEQIMQVYQNALLGFDIVCAVPKNKSKLSSSFFYYIFNKFSNLNYSLTTERFRILSRRVINRIETLNKTVSYRKPVYANCGLKTKNIVYKPIIKLPKQEDKFTKQYRKALAIDSLVIFTDLGYKCAVFISFLMLAFSICVALYSIIYRLLKNPVEGWASTILFISVSMFFLFTILTIILKYLQVLVNLVFKKAKYSFESIEKL